MPRVPFHRTALDRFDGGLNLRDQPSQLEANESPDLMNVTLDERGAVVKRLGFAKDGAMSEIGTGATPLLPLHYWAKEGQLIAQKGAELYRRTGAGAFTEITRAASANAFTTTARAAATDFNGTLVVVHPTDGVLTYSGSGDIAPVASSPNGDTIAVWQNKVWVGGDPANPPRVHSSANGDATDWAGTGSLTNDVRDKDDAAITALVAAPWSGLVAAKRASTHRFTNPIDGDYTTISVERGIPNHHAVIAHDGVFFAVTHEGIVATDGLAKPVVISGKIDPVFHAAQINAGNDTEFAAGAFQDRLVFSLTKNGATDNDRTLEFHPSIGWFTVHDFGAAGFANLADRHQLYMGDVNDGFLYETFSGGSDDGAAIASRYRTAWVEPNAQAQARFRRLKIDGRGHAGGPQLYVALDYTDSKGLQCPLDLNEDTETWGGTTWGGSTWEGTSHQIQDEAVGLGKGAAISFLFEETSSLVATGPALLGDGATEDIGAWALNSLELHHVPLALR